MCYYINVTQIYTYCTHQRKMAKKVKLRKLIQKAIRNQDLSKLQTLIDQFTQTFGEKETDEFINDVLDNASFEDQQWLMKQLPQERQDEMRDMVRNFFFENLQEGGFEFGKDFSLAPEGGFLLSDKAQEFLLNQVPEEHRESMKGEMYSLSQNPYELIEQQLGVPFFDNLVKRAKARLQVLDDEQTIIYLLAIVSGIEKCHPELTDFGNWFFSNVVSKKRYSKMLSVVDPEKKINMGFLTCDLICAAGGEKEILELNEGEGEGISLSGLKLLAKVWEGEKVSVKDLIAQLESQL